MFLKTTATAVLKNLLMDSPFGLFKFLCPVQSFMSFANELYQWDIGRALGQINIL